MMKKECSLESPIALRVCMLSNDSTGNGTDITKNMVGIYLQLQNEREKHSKKTAINGGLVVGGGIKMIFNGAPRGCRRS
jgi:hypothetical protein